MPAKKPNSLELAGDFIDRLFSGAAGRLDTVTLLPDKPELSVLNPIRPLTQASSKCQSTCSWLRAWLSALKVQMRRAQRTVEGANVAVRGAVET